jgi:hypothetical protein
MQPNQCTYNISCVVGYTSYIHEFMFLKLCDEPKPGNIYGQNCVILNRTLMDGYSNLCLNNSTSFPFPHQRAELANLA